MTTPTPVDKELLLAEMFRWRHNRATYQGGPLDNSTLDRAIAFIDNLQPRTTQYPVDTPAPDPLAQQLADLLNGAAVLVHDSSVLRRETENLRRKLAVRGTAL